MTQEQQRYLDVKFIYGRKDDRSTAGLRLITLILGQGQIQGVAHPRAPPKIGKK
jgi:hypothetical protein